MDLDSGTNMPVAVGGGVAMMVSPEPVSGLGITIVCFRTMRQ